MKEFNFEELKVSHILKEEEFLRYAKREIDEAKIVWIASHTPIMFFKSEQTGRLEKDYNEAILRRFRDNEKVTYYFMCEECVTKKIDKEIADPFELSSSLGQWSKDWGRNPNLHIYSAKSEFFPRESIWVAKRNKGLNFTLVKLLYEGSAKAMWLFMNEIPEGVLNMFESLSKNGHPFADYLKDWLETIITKHLED